MGLGIITEIREDTRNGGTWHGYEGYVVKTDLGAELFVGISDGQSCCENWGYVVSHDDLQEFVGQELIGASYTDEQLNTYEAPDIYEGGMMFVTCYTNRDSFQFCMYNEHNGSYGHEAVVMVNGELSHSETV